SRATGTPPPPHVARRARGCGHRAPRSTGHTPARSSDLLRARLRAPEANGPAGAATSGRPERVRPRPAVCATYPGTGGPKRLAAGARGTRIGELKERQTGAPPAAGRGVSARRRGGPWRGFVAAGGVPSGGLCRVDVSAGAGEGRRRFVGGGSAGVGASLGTGPGVPAFRRELAGKPFRVSRSGRQQPPRSQQRFRFAFEPYQLVVGLPFGVTPFTAWV